MNCSSECDHGCDSEIILKRARERTHRTKNHFYYLQSNSIRNPQACSRICVCLCFCRCCFFFFLNFIGLMFYFRFPSPCRKCKFICIRAFLFLFYLPACTNAFLILCSAFRVIFFLFLSFSLSLHFIFDISNIKLSSSREK